MIFFFLFAWKTFSVFKRLEINLRSGIIALSRNYDVRRLTKTKPRPFGAFKNASSFKSVWGEEGGYISRSCRDFLKSSVNARQRPSTFRSIIVLCSRTTTVCRHVYSMEISNGRFRAIQILFKFGDKKPYTNSGVDSLRSFEVLSAITFVPFIQIVCNIHVFRFRLFTEVIGNVEKRRSEHVDYKCILGVE